MTGPHAVLAGAATIAAAVIAGFAAAPRADGGDDARRWTIAALAGTEAGAFVTDTASGETMFCTPRHCRRLAVLAAAEAPPAAPPRTATVDEVLRAAPPDLAVPPPEPAGGGPVHPALRNF